MLSATPSNPDPLEPQTPGEGPEPGTSHPSDEDSPPESAMPVELKSLSDTQRKVAQMIAMGFDNQIIAEKTGMHWRSIWRMRQNPAIQAQAAMVSELARAELHDQQGRFDSLVTKSLDAYEGILDNKDASPFLKERVASSVLDRHPSGKFIRQRKQVSERHDPVSNETIDALKRIAAKTNAEVIDITSQTSSEAPSREPERPSIAPAPTLSNGPTHVANIIPSAMAGLAVGAAEDDDE